MISQIMIAQSLMPVIMCSRNISAVIADNLWNVKMRRNRSRSEKTPPRVMIGFTDHARDGSKYDPALTLPRTGSDSGSGFFL